MGSIIAHLKIASLVTMTICLYILWLAGNPFASDKGRWRRFIYDTWARAFARLLRVRLNVVGTPPKPPFFLVANHMGYVDIPTIRNVVEGVFVAKSEISGWPVVGGIIRDMGNIFINRQNRRDIPRAGSEVTEKVESGEGVIVFPEGTSSNGKQVLPFNSSFLEFAAKARIPVHCASVTYKSLDSSLPASISIAWADETPLYKHMHRLFSMRGFEATVSFGESAVESGDRKELARILEEEIRTSFTPLD